MLQLLLFTSSIAATVAAIVGLLFDRNSENTYSSI
jgi:hypothetical protein